MKLIAKVALPILVLLVALLLYRHAVISSSPFVIVAQLAALALNVSARASFGAGQFRAGPEPAGGAVVHRGPYRLVRHPMYTGALVFVWASILGHWSPVHASIGLAATAVVAVRVHVEERFLRDRYPDYADYARRTKRLVPYVI